jgi:hypothetical protein
MLRNENKKLNFYSLIYDFIPNTRATHSDRFIVLLNMKMNRRTNRKENKEKL